MTVSLVSFAAVFVFTLHLVQGESQQSLLDAYHDGHGFTLKKQLVKYAAAAAESTSTMMSQAKGLAGEPPLLGSSTTQSKCTDTVPVKNMSNLYQDYYSLFDSWINTFKKEKTKIKYGCAVATTDSWTRACCTYFARL
ncbi:hypothetical protein ACHWQZ_G012182 [Mnemiopsis leidyi]